MRFFFLPVALTVLANIGLAIASPVNEATSLMRRTYSVSCRDKYLIDNWTLKSNCRDASGSHVRSRLDLSKCFANGAGGSLVCQPQAPNIATVCTSSGLAHGHIVTASCNNGDGGNNVVDYDLDKCVSIDDNGHLSCSKDIGA